MAESSESYFATLLHCDETEDSCFDGLAVSGSDGRDPSRRGSDPLIRFPVWSEESFAWMMEREKEFLPRDDYLSRLRSGEVELSIRREASDWISKAHDHYGFGPLSFCLSMNYLDRFLSLDDVTKNQAWVKQILAVVCLSIAMKMEEPAVPLSLDLQIQVGKPICVFDAETIQRMELLVLGRLEWRLNAPTPCSFVDYFLSKIIDEDPIPTTIIDKSIQLILSTIKGLDFLEFRPSEIALAATILVAGEIKSVDIDQAISPYTALVEKGRVVKCIEMMNNLARGGSVEGVTGGLPSGQSVVPQSPIGVLEAKCFSNSRCDETTLVAGSSANSDLRSNPSDIPDTKRIKLDHAISGEKSSNS